MTTERQEPIETSSAPARTGARQAQGAADQPARRPSGATRRLRAGRGNVPPEQIDELIYALGDATHPLHVVAVDELVAIGPAAVAALCAALGPGQSWLTVYRAAEAAGRIGDGRAAGPLLQALNHPNSNVRWSVVHALTRIGDVRALLELRRVAQSDQGRTSWGESVAGAAQSALDEMRRRSVWGQSFELIKTAVVAALMIFALVLAYGVVGTLRGELAAFGRVIPGQTQLPQLTLPTVAPAPTASTAQQPAPTVAPTAALPTSEPVLAPTSGLAGIGAITGTVRQDANVRPFPDTNNQPIGRVSLGDEIIFLARTPNAQWYLVRLGARRSTASAINSPDGSGWVNQALVSPPEGDLPVQQPDAAPAPTASP